MAGIIEMYRFENNEICYIRLECFERNKKITRYDLKFKETGEARNITKMPEKLLTEGCI
ncbi:hypothetical protein [Erwinia mallotivora]|uniref:hypothetical protein n=1 Tax=Erwinia mallotivora TaxID=69222 RepID=UPI0004AE9AC6|nr:hypothetical protein [Erwinia mallotivora]